MSNCSSHPGVGREPDGLSGPVYDTYNPSEVRLYGRPATREEIFKITDEQILQRIKSSLRETSLRDEDLNTLVRIVKEAAIGTVDNDVLAGILKQQIVLAIFDDELKFSQLPVSVNIPAKNFEKGGERYIKSIGVIYGYAYEGHCYKLPKPQIMYLPEEPRKILGGDCGCDCGYVPELGYAVWQIDKLERVIALDVRSDDVKTLVLDENMPGSRSPMAYAQTMALAPQRHRD
ncbi:hypothetical protein HR059_10155 [Sinorhizobium meliloti WSM1022]|jgi:hypothetical protein|uniref:Uncharacterized protein n=2 Tax=Sinorhizobium TaxID=28105 RepID=H0G6T9_RHIML|nr:MULTISPECIES: hypothetical protein [Sinorhizobium]PII38542.1 hypothetical protein T190_19225 [Sinorhizobium meliloti CCBAU 01290]ASQ03560.1 hypothetical protein CDO23_06125 [Sinorhizobium meliloti]EHK74978.1 hypothetical protein SM0020_26086 [Sinorhizobium meliloti CCNWSX0020]MCO6425480.1 hypothetical protein [Sinorhizobium meliloti]MDW9408237.1 hypothetical protein [Sinorhizobium meliloti]